MKRIGIYTFWNVPNYGAFMQAYALQRVLESLAPKDEIKQIGYLCKKHYNSYYAFINCQHKWSWVNPYFYRDILERLHHRQQTYNLRNFLQYYESIPHISVSRVKELDNIPFDVVILGSDIIWDYSQKQFGDDPHLFGGNFNARKIISYAPSFGTVTVDMSVPDYVRQGLNRLEAISVRDENSAHIIEKITGNKAIIVLDPTLLWNFKKDKNVVCPDIPKYILVYGIEFSEKMICQAKKYAAEHHLKLIWLKSGSENFNWCDEVIEQQELTPFEWAGYFSKAEAVMTSRYHGLLFGLIFERPIIFYPIPFIMAKASSLIDSLDLGKVLVVGKSFDAQIEWLWNYPEINKRIGILRQHSIEFLKNAIEV